MLLVLIFLEVIFFIYKTRLRSFHNKQTSHSFSLLIVQNDVISLNVIQFSKYYFE